MEAVGSRSDEVSLRLAARSLQSSAAGAPALIAASTVFASWLRGEGVVEGRLAAWVWGTVVAELVIVGVSVLGLRRVALRMAATNVVMAISLAVMTASGALSVWAPAPGHIDVPLMYQLWVCGTAAAAMAIAGGLTRLFVAGTAAMLSINTVLLAAGAARAPAMLSVLSALYLGVLAFGHVATHRALRDAVTNELRSQQLLDELASVNDALAYEASHDLLTGIANRRRIIAELDHALVRIGKDVGEIGVLFIDLDGFKEVNDTYGHGVGDELLALAAERIAAELGPTDLVGRQGGDEFIVLVRSATRPGVHDVAERIRATLETTFRSGDHLLSLSASIGVVWCESSGLSADDVLRRADLALYRAKDRGRNLVVEYHRDNPVLVDDNVRSVRELREALHCQEIQAFFQPIVDMDSGAIVGAEALARWPQRDGSVLAPGQFLRALTEAGLDTDLGIHMALQIVAYRTEIATLVPDAFRIGLNVAFRRTRANDAVEALASLAPVLMPTGASVLEGMTIELTENAAMRDLRDTRRALERARELGICIALDDFGTGQSSLTLVRQLPLDVIKLDRAFVHGVAGDRANQAVVAAVVDLAAGVGASVVAEGVERIEDAIELRDLGCGVAQGFLYAPAVPGPVLREWLETSAPWQAPDSEQRQPVSVP